MIDKNKTYRTREGREVRIYTTDGGGPRPIHGAIFWDDFWHMRAWSPDGKSALYSDELVEVKPRIKREVWANVYRHDDGYEFATYHDSAIDAELERGDAMIARVRLMIDCEEGEGL